MAKNHEDWPWYQVKAAIEAAGKTLAGIALSHGLDPSTTSKVKSVPIPSVQSVIADEIGVSAKTIWPTRYDDGGNPVPRHKWIKTNTRRPGGHVQNRQVA